MSLALFPVVVLTGFCFAGLGLAINAISPNYDFFLYYFTLVITPMVLLCGVFYPVTQLPQLLQDISAWLPLTHAVELARPIVRGDIPANWFLHILALLAYGGVGFWLALGLTRRRLLK
jgi:lipooligosaccharide transport system permease protein